MMTLTLISPRSAQPAAPSPSLTEKISSISKLRLLKIGISIYRFRRIPKYNRHPHYEINHQNLSSLKYDKIHITCITIASIALDVCVPCIYQHMVSWAQMLAGITIVVFVSDVHRMLLLGKEVLSSLVTHERQSNEKLLLA